MQDNGIVTSIECIKRAREVSLLELQNSDTRNTMNATLTKATFLPTFYKLRVCFLFVIAISHCVAPTTTRAMDDVTDLAALLAIKSHLVDHPGSSLNSWNYSLHHCNWEGVTCGRKHNRVTLLDLSSHGFVGAISPLIGNLSFLEELLLFNNSLHGQIPPEIGYLFRLQVLHLHNNMLDGEIPSSLANCINLQEFDARNNNLSGKLPIELGALSKLKVLAISSNSFTGPLFDVIENLTSLEVISVTDNAFTGTISSDIGKMQNLNFFAVGDNKLSGTIPVGLGQCVGLQYLNMHGNFLHGFIPPLLSTLGGLQTMDLSRNNLSGTIPNNFTRFPLHMLNLSYNNFEGRVPTVGLFSNKNAIALNGNKTLCGGILEVRLPRCLQQAERKTKRKTPHSVKLKISIICPLVGVLSIVIVTWFCLKYHRKIMVPTTPGFMVEPFVKVSYNMLLKATNGFSSQNLVGIGNFGSVFRGNLDGMAIAVKVLNLQTRGASKSFIAECKALRNVRHRNLLRIITVCSSIDFKRNDFKALVYEFMPNGSLDRWLHGDGGEKLTLVQRVDIALDVAHALNYLHNHCEIPIIHCDLKPKNILLDNNMVAHVGDFGLAKFLAQAQPQHPNPSSSIGILGTIGYVAPEYGLGSKTSPKGDLYSYGILVLELITGKRPTHINFQEGYNLQMYAGEGLPDNIFQVVDPTLEHHEISEVDDIRTTQDVPQRRVECMLSMVSVGIECSKHFPQDRMKINNVIGKLQVAKDGLCHARQRRNFQRGVK